MYGNYKWFFVRAGQVVRIFYFRILWVDRSPRSAWVKHNDLVKFIAIANDHRLRFRTATRSLDIWRRRQVHKSLDAQT